MENLISDTIFTPDWGKQWTNMGYSTPATLKKVYQHTMAGKRAEVNSMINSHMNEMFTHDENKQERGVVG